MECIFCKIVAGEIGCKEVYQDDHCLAFMDIFPRAYGHSLVIPKKHYVTLDEMPHQEAQAFIVAVNKTAALLKEKLQVPAYNLISNNGPESGQEVPHLHFHIFPRSAGDPVGLHFPPVIDEYKQKIDEIYGKLK